MEVNVEESLKVLERRAKIVHLQNLSNPTRTFCGRRFYIQKHVTDRLKNCTCRKCWEVIRAQFPGVMPGKDSVITRLV